MTTVIVSALVGGIVSYFGALLKGMIDARSRIDSKLRASRIKAYRGVWRITGHLPEWPRASDVTRGTLHEMSCALRNWYFGMDRSKDDGTRRSGSTEEGEVECAGMYLSRESMDAYRILQSKLSGMSKEGSTEPVGPDHGDYGTLRKLCSRLRSELTRDLLSRQRGAFDWTPD